MARRWVHQYPPGVPTTLDYPKISLPDLLKQTAERAPEQEAVLFLGKRIRYCQLFDDVVRLANSLKDLGVKKGDRVAIMLPNSPQAVIAYYAILMIGAVVVQVNPMYTERELTYQLIDSGAERIFCLDLFFEKVRRVKKDTGLKEVIVTSIKDYLPFPKNWFYALKLRKDGIDSIPEDKQVYRFITLLQQGNTKPLSVDMDITNDLAVIQYTGGTTGLPKGAMLTHFNLVANVYQIASWFYKVKPSEVRILGVLPFFHAYGMTTVMNFAIQSSGTMILVPKFDIQQLLKTIHKYRPTLFPGVPTLYVALMNDPKIGRYNLSSIEACISGSAPLPFEVQEKFERLTKGRLIEGYGLTETSPVTHANLVWDRVKSGTIGLPWPDTDCRIVDLTTGEELPPGQIGELQIKGPQVMKGYWNRPEETKAVLKEGWLSTGDIAKMDDDGYFYLIDRKKDIIIAGGYNIYPREIEEVLFEHPGILEAAVVGVPDEYRGETVKAYIVCKKGFSLTAEEVEQFCRQRLASYKVPRTYEFLESLPKSALGKVLRRVLKEERVKP